MGFNFGILKRDGARLVMSKESDTVHDPACDYKTSGTDMCEFGFDCFRHTDDRNFYCALLDCAPISFDPHDRDEMAFRITDFNKAHRLADTMCEANRPHFHYLVDLLKNDETLYVDGS